jgi:hypothetical protein
MIDFSLSKFGAKHFSDDKAEDKDKAGDSVFFKLFLALALNLESEKSIIKTEYSHTPREYRSPVGTRITL